MLEELRLVPWLVCDGPARPALYWSEQVDGAGVVSDRARPRVPLRQPCAGLQNERYAHPRGGRTSAGQRGAWLQMRAAVVVAGRRGVAWEQPTPFGSCGHLHRDARKKQVVQAVRLDKTRAVCYSRHSVLFSSSQTAETVPAGIPLATQPWPSQQPISERCGAAFSGHIALVALI